MRAAAVPKFRLSAQRDRNYPSRAHFPSEEEVQAPISASRRLYASVVDLHLHAKTAHPPSHPQKHPDGSHHTIADAVNDVSQGTGPVK